jgi:4-coumarate--CoA ligase
LTHFVTIKLLLIIFRFGEAPRAYIVLKPSTSQSESVSDSIKTFVKDNAAEYKQLSGGVQFIDFVPKSAAGKILRKDLVALYKKEILQ